MESRDRSRGREFQGSATPVCCQILKKFAVYVVSVNKSPGTLFNFFLSAPGEMGGGIHRRQSVSNLKINTKPNKRMSSCDDIIRILEYS